MSKLSLCILDDKIPVEQLTGINIDDTSYIDGNILRHCLSLQNDGNISDWGDLNLRNFVDTIKDDSDFVISGFKNHSFFFNHRENVLFNPDIIVFDWDMGDGGHDSSANLLKILSSTYCLVAVFTGEDTEEGVSHELEQSKFSEYKNRCLLVKKQDSDSAKILKSRIKERNKDFSFEFGNNFRKASLVALDEILVELGKVTTDELYHYFKIEDENDLRVFIAEKYSGLFSLSKLRMPRPNSNGYKCMDSLLHVVRKKFEKKISTINTKSPKSINPPDTNDGIIEKLWSYRLYHKYPDTDEVVRKGDIIFKDGQYYFIINSDCHLPLLWKKNLGFVNVIPLYLVDNSNERLKEILNLTQKGNSREYKQNSFSEKMRSFSEGAYCMPFIPVENNYKTFLFFAKSITSIQIPKPNLNERESLDKKCFKYENFEGYKRICTLSEPFLTPIISNILSAISGHGCPDYSNATIDLLDKNIKQIFV